ncbi:MAG: Oxidoreductase protein [uncultured bacterium]|nr:MAG: Oxidoreductase protein [uncultured bacterium]
MTGQKITRFNCYTNLQDALAMPTDLIVIANATYLHYSTLVDVIRCHYQGVVLVEKPLFYNMEFLPNNKIKKILVGYNLRFCEALHFLKKILQEEKLISFSVNVGHHLPLWRKDTDYRQCYSAKKSQGGGVLRDLSHELDYSLWLCGACIQVTSVGGKYSELDIDCEDVYSILMRCTECPVVNIQINYLDRVKRRDIIIHTQKHTIYVDLLKGKVMIDDVVAFVSDDALTNSYIRQHEAIVANDWDTFCSYAEGLKIVKLIEQIEKANHTQQWVNA